MTAKLSPAGRIAFDGNGKLYFADTSNHLIRMIDSEGIVHRVAGQPPADGMKQPRLQWGRRVVDHGAQRRHELIAQPRAGIEPGPFAILPKAELAPSMSHTSRRPE